MMSIVAVILFLILTFDIAIGLLHNFNAFIKSDDPEKELLRISNWINITRVCLFFCNQSLIHTQDNDRPWISLYR
jgi:hypothetical protein